MLAGLASTLVENIFCGLANRSWHHYAARPVGFLRPSAVAALNACLTLEGTSLGLAQGELRGAINNLSTIVQIISPIFWGQLYSAGVARGRPGAFYFVVAAGAALQLVAAPRGGAGRPHLG